MLTCEVAWLVPAAPVAAVVVAEVAWAGGAPVVSTEEVVVLVV